MIIANPIFDVIFKYLMSDVTAAKTVITRIINQEIIELDFLPQEQSIFSKAGNLTVIRLDFIATIKSKSGKITKVLIEMQKSKTNTEIHRFRRYLGENYIKLDQVEGQEINLPIICIYFLGSNTDLENVCVKNKRNFVDAIDERAVEKIDDIMELLTHDTYFIFIENLKKEKENHPLLRLLMIFDQDLVKGGEIKYLLESEYYDKVDDNEIKYLIMRLFEASLQADLLRQAQLEQDLEKDIAYSINRNRLFDIAEKEKAIKEKEKAIKEKEAALIIAKKLENEKEEISTIAKKLENEKSENESELKRLKALLDGKNIEY